MSRARGPPRKIGVTTSTERLRRVALAYVVGVTLDVSCHIIEGRSWFFSGSAMSLAPSSINPEKRKPRETRKGNLLLLYARNLTAFCTYFNEHTLTSHRSCVTTLAHTCCRHLPTYASISHPSDSSPFASFSGSTSCSAKMAATSGAPVVARTKTTEKNRRDNFDRAVEMGGISLRGGCHPRCFVADYRRSIVVLLRFRDVFVSIVDQSRQKKTKGNNKRKPTAAVCTKSNCLLCLL